MNILDIKLKDDTTSVGGISYTGYTVKDFLDEQGLPYDMPISTLNSMLKLCGIKQISKKEIKNDRSIFRSKRKRT